MSIEDLTRRGYDNDALALSPSVANTLIHESPRHAWYFHRLLGGHEKEPSDAMMKGKLFHAALLEEGAGIAVLPYDAFRSNEAKEAKRAAIERDLLPITQPKWEEMEPAVEEIRFNVEMAGYGHIFEHGHCEVKVEWNEPARNKTGSILCHGRLDWIDEGLTHIIDLKTGDGSAHPSNCATKLAREGGAIQDAAYRSAVMREIPDLAGRVDVTFLFIETKPPFAVTPVQSAGTMQELGESRWLRAIEIWNHCIQTNQWPAYEAQPPHRADAPVWALNQEMMAQELMEE